MHQQTLFPDEPLAPSSGSDTSKAAAVKQTPRSEKQRDAILAYIRSRGEYGATDHEMRAHFGMFSDEINAPLANGDTQRARRWELCGGKHHKQRPVLVVHSGRSRKVASGNDAKVWVIK